MRYFYSTEHEIGLKIDTEKNQAFIKRSGEERLAKSGSKLVADTTIENREITSEEYEKI